MRKWALWFVLSFGATTAVWATEQAPSAVQTSPTEEPNVDAPQTGGGTPESGGNGLPESVGGMGTALARTALMLALVVALIYLILNLGLRRLMGIRGAPSGHKPTVAVLERVPLSQKHWLYVVRVAGEYLLVGGGESGVSLVSRLNGESMQTQSPGDAPSDAASPFLAKLLSKRDRS